MAAHVGPLEDEDVLEKRAEDRNPAMHNAEHYFAGSVEQAIAECRSKRSLLVVFLKGGDEESYTADETLHVSLGWLKAKHIVALRLHDDLSNTNPKAFRKAKAFREIFPNIRDLPFLMLLAPDGRPMGSLLGSDVSTLAAEAIEHAHDMLVAKQALPPEPAAARPTLPSQPRVAPATTFTRPPGPTSAASGNPNASNLSASNSASTLGGVPSTDITQLTSALMSASQQAAQAAAVHGSLAAQHQNSRALPAGTAPAQPQPPRQLPRPTAGGIASAPTAPSAATGQAAAALAQNGGGGGSRAAGAQSRRSDKGMRAGSSAGQRMEAQPAASSSSAAAAAQRPTTSGAPAAAASAVDAPVLAAEQEARVPQAVPPRTPPAGPVASGSPGVGTINTAESADRIAHLSFRLTDGSLLRADFPADADLGSVFLHIAQHRTDGAASYRLRTPSVPYRFLEAADAERTLHSLDLCPRSLLVLQPSDGGGSVLAGGNSLAGAFARLRKNVQSWLVSLVIVFIGFFAGMFSSNAGRQQPAGSPQQPTLAARRQPPTALAADRNTRGTATAFKGGQVFQGSKDTTSSLHHRNQPDKGKE